MIKRSSPHNRFYHSLLNDIYKQMVEEKMVIVSFYEFKQQLKNLDENYQRIDNFPVSTANITDKQLMNHIEYIRLFSSHWGFTIKHDEQAWNELIEKFNR